MSSEYEENSNTIIELKASSPVVINGLVQWNLEEKDGLAVERGWGCKRSSSPV